ncbi:MAG: sigma-70 family RNA polymerase sigma factor [Acidobacteriota bacterium]|nr:sigma-70 family RNA polymerase sigma factor [Acidobacteriota bacterium]
MNSQPHMLDEDGQVVGFDEIYDRHFRDIFNYILRRTANVSESEDLTAQVFFLAMRHACKQRRKPTRIPAWLFRIATNEVNAWFRTQKRRPWAASLADDDSALQLQDKEAADAEQDLLQNQVFLQLNAALRTLKPDDQTVIALRYFEQKPFEEVANILGKRVGAVTMKTKRALAKLQTELTRRGFSHERIREGFARSSQTGYRRADLPAESTP